MLDPRKVEETVELIRAAVDRGVQIYVIVNNRARGKSPLITHRVAERFAARHRGA
jgi:phosphatidylserine/phosphatidylglycerophosphate/cardiolipin synthase-like enzyme